MRLNISVNLMYFKFIVLIWRPEPLHLGQVPDFPVSYIYDARQENIKPRTVYDVRCSVWQ